MKKEAALTLDFNPRSREGSDTPQVIRFINGCIFQSTLPRRERRTICGFVASQFKISIHAPAKGATCRNGFFFPDLHIISIHAPAKGATGGVMETMQEKVISIHAPAKGATISVWIIWVY